MLPEDPEEPRGPWPLPHAIAFWVIHVVWIVVAFHLARGRSLFGVAGDALLLVIGAAFVLLGIVFWHARRSAKRSSTRAS